MLTRTGHAACTMRRATVTVASRTTTTPTPACVSSSHMTTRSASTTSGSSAISRVVASALTSPDTLHSTHTVHARVSPFHASVRYRRGSAGYDIRDNNDILFNVSWKVKSGLWSKPNNFEALKTVPALNHTENADPVSDVSFPEDELFQTLMERRPRMRMEFQKVYKPTEVSVSSKFARMQHDFMTGKHQMSEDDAYVATELAMADELAAFDRELIASHGAPSLVTRHNLEDVIKARHAQVVKEFKEQEAHRNAPPALSAVEELGRIKEYIQFRHKHGIEATRPRMMRFDSNATLADNGAIYNAVIRQYDGSIYQPRVGPRYNVKEKRPDVLAAALETQKRQARGDDIIDVRGSPKALVPYPPDKDTGADADESRASVAGKQDVAPRGGGRDGRPDDGNIMQVVNMTAQSSSSSSSSSSTSSSSTSSSQQPSESPYKQQRKHQQRQQRRESGGDVENA